MRDRKQTRQVPPCVPDDAVKGGIVWEDSAEAQAEDRAFRHAANELAKRRSEWLRVKAELDADWLRNAEAELAAVSGDVERDQLLERIDARLTADEELSRKQEQEYLEAVAALIRERAARANKEWLAAAQKKLAAATAAITRDIVRHEREVFGIKRKRR